jgi:hypothetical protein
MKTYITKKVLEMVSVEAFKSDNIDFALDIKKCIKGDLQFSHLVKESDNNLLKDLLRFTETDRTSNPIITDLVTTFRNCEQKVKKEINPLESMFNNPIFSIFKVMKESKIDFFVVGGTVRDAIAGKPSNDMDFCTSCDLGIVNNIFEESDKFSVKETGKQFLVLTVTHLPTKTSFEIAQFRKDKDNSGGIPGTIIEDAERRDFTNSALYFNINTNTLVDPLGNLDDAINMLLKFNGDADKRIEEDPLRVIRLYKFAGRGFKPHQNSLKAVRRNFESAINEVSKSRLMVELEKITGVR